MTDEQIIDALATILRQPSDRKTERNRYIAYRIGEVCTWRTPEELEELDSMPSVIPLFGGPPDKHYPRHLDEHASQGNQPVPIEDVGVPISDLGCNGCIYIYNTKTDHELIYDDRKSENLIAEARKGDRDADAVLCIIAAKHARVGSPLSQQLGDYVSEILEQRIEEAKYSEGGNKHTNFARNLRISCFFLGE